MTSLVWAALTIWSVWVLSGVGGRFPWRIADLPTSPEDPKRPTPSNLRRPRADTATLEADLPAAAELLRIATTAGHSVHAAVRAVAHRGSGPAAVALRAAVDEFDRGTPLSDALSALPARFGAPLRPLTTTLVMALETGQPLEPALTRLADRERRRQRRRSEERVRRLPVSLLVPLVTLVLPAFVVLAIVPVGLRTVTQLASPLTTSQEETP